MLFLKTFLPSAATEGEMKEDKSISLKNPSLVALTKTFSWVHIYDFFLITKTMFLFSHL